MVGRDNACPLSSSRKDVSMKYGFPYRRVPPRFPFGRPAGLANLVAGILLGVFIYRKGMEEGKWRKARSMSKPIGLSSIVFLSTQPTR